MDLPENTFQYTTCNQVYWNVFTSFFAKKTVIIYCAALFCWRQASDYFSRSERSIFGGREDGTVNAMPSILRRLLATFCRRVQLSLFCTCRGIKLLTARYHEVSKNCGQVNTCGTCVPGPPRATMRHTPSQNQRWGSVRVSEAEIGVLLCCEQRRLTW